MELIGTHKLFENPQTQTTEERTYIFPTFRTLCYSSRPLNSAVTSLQASAPRESGTDRMSVQTFTHFRDQRLATVGQRRSFFDEARENSASSKSNISTVLLNVVCALIHNIAN